MTCPKCGSVRLGVIETRDAPENTVRRRRTCYICGYRFTTYELTALELTKQIGR